MRGNVGGAPPDRIRVLRDVDPNPDGSWVVYWMTAARRRSRNFALDRAVSWSRTAGRPLVILEALRVGYRWASARLHRFVLDGMAERARGRWPSGVLYYPYVEERPGDGAGLLETLAAEAVAVVGDDFPCFFLPRMSSAAAERLPVRFEVVDGNGLLPVRAAPQAYPSAYHFRRYLQRELGEHLGTTPSADPLTPLEGLDRPTLPDDVTARWPSADAGTLEDPALVARLPIDQDVGAVEARGGEAAGRRALERFLQEGLPSYADERNHPDAGVVSRLSPYLHFGNVSAHEVFDAVAGSEGWTPLRLSDDTRGKREGWWGMSAGAEAFLDQLVTWRELGFGTTALSNGYDRYETLPDWARATLNDHRADPRPWSYGLEELEAADTHDPVWNAAQRELVEEGHIHNYLRMLWGKKILEWSPDPETALAVMIELNNKYGVDGRDPNSYSGIFWTLGRYDRPWPERPVFGKVRSMSSERTRKKVRMEEYLRRYGSD